jgi:membrane-associated phospholipid phosphatase
VADGIALLRGDPRAPDAIVVLDSDGQHDPGRIPAFVEASRAADVVIGHRRDRSPMPVARRLANRAASLLLLAAARSWVPDTQNGMRLFRTAALAEVPPVAGGYEAESRHLRALLASGHTVASVEIPTIYDGEPSHFRPLADTLRVARALGTAAKPATDAGTGREALAELRAWTPRLAALILTAIALGLAMPIFQPLDNSLAVTINGLGDGPEWLYQALDPHTRNYILLLSITVVAAAATLRRPRYVLGAALTVLLAAYVAGAALEVVKLFIERARPEEVLGAQIQLSHDRSWAHLASYPSGHLIVTAAMAAAAGATVPWLRRPLLAYVAIVGMTRVLFGAHFPLDVLAGAVMGYEFGLFSAGLLAKTPLLPALAASAARAPEHARLEAVR